MLFFYNAFFLVLNSYDRFSLVEWLIIMMGNLAIVYFNVCEGRYGERTKKTKCESYE
jgi:hypothetical protein